jgi:hypothetical protein
MKERVAPIGLVAGETQANADGAMHRPRRGSHVDHLELMFDYEMTQVKRSMAFCG